MSAAFAAFLARGYAGTSTLEIATRAKVSKRELYAHFGSKQAMLVACIDHGVALMRLPLDLPPARDRAGFKAMLTAFGANFLRIILSPRVVAIYRLALAEAERAPEIAATLDSAGRGGARAALAEMLERAQADKLLGGDNAMDATERFLALLLGGLHLRLLLGVIPPPSTTEMAARAEMAADALLMLYPPPKEG